MAWPPDGLCFSVLGPVHAWRDGKPLELGTPQQQALLVVLLLRDGRSASADELVDAMWGENPPSRAIGALRTYVSRLRRILEEPDAPPRVLVSVGSGYALRIESDCIDVAIFEEKARSAANARAGGDLTRAAQLIHEALDLWNGPPLAGVPGPDAETQRDRLVQRRLAVYEARLDIDLQLGEHTQIVGELTALSSEHPLRERLRALLMLALYRCGRQAEALGVFADTRRTLAGELGIDPGPELQELHQRILEADPDLAPATAETSHPSARRSLPRPAQLPADVSDFTGREDVVSKLKKAITGNGASTVVVSAVDGIGGVGKTTVAVHVAHSVREHFPDGQLHVDLQGVGDQPADSGSVLAGFLRALGATESAIPEKPAERAALFRSTVADRRILMLLDNARDAEQVRPLLPGSAGSAVLVTSRARLAGLSGASLIDLDVFDPRDGLAMFARIVGADRVAAEREDAMRVVASCGCLPLAVRIVASRLNSRPNWTIASLATRLADERRRLVELRVGDLTVEASFRLGYDQLDPEHARAFRLLAVPDGPSISLPASAAVLDLDAFAAEEILESLVDVAMLESPVPGRYRFHDLLRLFARQQPESAGAVGERADALHRLVDFYLATVRNAYLVVQAGHPIPNELGTTVSAGLPIADADAAHWWALVELSGVLAVADQATRGTAQSIALAADLVLGVEPLVEAGFSWRDVEPVARAVATAAAKCGDKRAEARALSQLIGALLEMYRLDETDTLADRAAMLCRETNDSTVLFEVLMQRGYIAIRRRQYDEALQFYDEAIALHADGGNRHSEAEGIRNAAFAYTALGRGAEAVAAGERSLAIFRELGDERGEAHTVYQLGRALHGVGRLDEAIANYADGLAVCRTIGLRTWEAYTLFRLAEVRLDAGSLTEAVTDAEASLALSRELYEDYNEARALTVLGRALEMLGQADRSQACLRDAYKIFRRLGVPDADDVAPLLNAER
jgi:DNA-binding SARP family transcriptional activator/tetratricopeptide (TPR) repeat protein